MITILRPPLVTPPPKLLLPPGWIVPQRRRPVRGPQRGAALADLQLVCGAGPYELDVLVREHAGPAQLELVGQVTLGNRIYEPVCDLTLELVHARTEEPVAGTRTDEFGEFDLATAPESAYGLRLGDAADAPCVLVWEGDGR